MSSVKSAIELNSRALKLRKQLGEDQSSPIQIFNLLSGLDHVSIVYYPLGSGVSGVYVRAGDESLIAINSMLTQGRQRFTAAHELYHLNEQKGFRNVVCSVNIGGSKDPEEQNADSFASYFLAPDQALRDYVSEIICKGGATLALGDVVAIEQFFGMSHQAALYRLQKDGYINAGQREAMKAGVMICARDLGYDIDLYRTTNPEHARKQTLGSYIGFTKRLLDLGYISTGKAEDFLITAFREDIVDHRDQELDQSYD
ncbi:MAG: ImmA/IrrE family metallo-endopeptidase [Chloroflexi bacterium]|nr:ImmA/IrrE family metallo-endopeptidase [Chloroflexota bacterium]